MPDNVPTHTHAPQYLLGSHNFVSHIHQSLQVLSKDSLPQSCDYPVTKIRHLSEETKAAVRNNDIQYAAPKLHHDARLLVGSLSELLPEPLHHHEENPDKSHNLMSLVDQLDEQCAMLSHAKTLPCLGDTIRSLEQVTGCLSTCCEGQLPEKGPYTYTKYQTLVKDIKDTFNVRLTLSEEDGFAKYQELWMDSKFVEASISASN